HRWFSSSACRRPRRLHSGTGCRSGVAIVIAGAERVPVGSRIAETAAADLARFVQLPNVDFAAVVLKQDVGKAVAVKIARSFDMPARSGIAETAAADLPPLGDDLGAERPVAGANRSGWSSCDRRHSWGVAC